MGSPGRSTERTLVRSRVLGRGLDLETPIWRRYEGRIYRHFPTREALLDAVMDHAFADVTAAVAAAEPNFRRASVQRSSEFAGRRGASSIVFTRASASTRRGCSRKRSTGVTCPSIAVIAPLIERGQKKGPFRRDLPTACQFSMLLAIAHAASGEVRSGRIAESEVETAMLSTALNASQRST